MYVVLQTVTDFRTQYISRYNGTMEESEEDDDNLVVRSFTDDPDIPLQQIMVRTYSVPVYNILATVAKCRTVHDQSKTIAHVHVRACTCTVHVLYIQNVYTCMYNVHVHVYMNCTYTL